MADPNDKETKRRNDIILPGDLKGVDLIKQVEHPEPYLLRRQYINHARSGEYPKTNCPHPVQTVHQYVDDKTKRQANLFACGVCNSALWLTDPHGVAAADE